ncbi:hypothetical protein [Sediminibacillus massiliensis]|uniref:hypothetical protein n=1 Tax=Sediminibacillus massiliensis TaxID=1926277 RepID=UPI0015C3C4EA|nr:hypothetical protein [Sediminibacillus massiliensis]
MTDQEKLSKAIGLVEGSDFEDKILGENRKILIETLHYARKLERQVMEGKR